MQLTAPLRVRGWLLDVYPSDFGKVAVWVISENGERIKLTDSFQPCIYVSGKQDDLERLISRLCSNQKIASLKFAQKYAQPTDTEKSRVLEITVKDCRQIPSLTLEILRMGDYLRYEIHNCDIQNDRSYLFSNDLFPLAFVEVQVSKAGLDYTLLDSVESTDYVIPKLRVLKLEVDVAKKGIIATFDDAIDKIHLKARRQRRHRDRLWRRSHQTAAACLCNKRVRPRRNSNKCRRRVPFSIPNPKSNHKQRIRLSSF